MTVAGRSDLTEHTDAGLLIDFTDLRHDQSASALCPRLEISKHRRTDRTVEFCKIRSHRGHNETILQLNVPDPTLLKKLLVHCVPSFNIVIPQALAKRCTLWKLHEQFHPMHSFAVTRCDIRTPESCRSADVCSSPCSLISPFTNKILCFYCISDTVNALWTRYMNQN